MVALILIYIITLQKSFVKIVEKDISTELNSKSNEIHKVFIGVSIGTGAGIIFSLADNKMKEISEKINAKNIGEIMSLPGDGIILTPFVLGGYIFGIVSDNEKIRKAFIRSISNLIFSTLIVQTLKFSGRTRPYASDFQYDFRFPGIENKYRSFPSGHAQASSSVYFTLRKYLCETRLCSAVMFSIPLLVSLGRILANDHWLSDTASGMIIGSSFEIF